MDVRRMIAIIAVLAVLAFGTVTPSPARANTTDDFIYAGIALGAYVGLVVICTSIAYGTPSSLTLTPNDIDVRRDAQEPAVRLGPRCRQTSPTPTLLCW